MTDPWIAAAVFLLLGVFAGAGVAALVSLVAHRLGRDAVQRRRLAGLAFAVVGGAFVVVAMGRVTDPRLVDAALGAVAAGIIRTAPDLVAAVVIVVAGVLTGSALLNLLRNRVQAVRPELARPAGRFGYWTVIAITAIVAAAQVGLAVDVLERILLLAVGGLVLAVAVGVGLGSQGLLAAVIAGRHVAGMVGVGDEVEVDGLRGRVLALGRASVRLALDGAHAEVPNGRFLHGTVLVRRDGADASATTTD